MILDHGVGTTIRQSKCVKSKKCTEKPSAPRCYTDECYRPRIVPNDVVKLYLGLRQRKYCKNPRFKHLPFPECRFDKILCNAKGSAIFSPQSMNDCQFRGAWHFETWDIKTIETIKFKYLTEEIAFNDGFQHRPWFVDNISLGCINCLVFKLCTGRGCAGSMVPSLWQLQLYLTTTYNAKLDSLFDIITKKNNGV